VLAKEDDSRDFHLRTNFTFLSDYPTDINL
jgi:hypothetical protein